MTTNGQQAGTGAATQKISHRKTIILLGVCICLLAGIAAAAGIFTTGGPGPYTYPSIRGRAVAIWGKGLYQHMSAEAAPQGIAQDYVTLFVAIPLLVFSLVWFAKGSVRGRFLLAGTLGYFLVTYLFYTVMGMYNALFLVYVALLGTSFYAFLLCLFSFPLLQMHAFFTRPLPSRFTGGFLVFNALAIGLLWLSVVVPPLIDGSVIPVQVEHYTTLIVQGLDLGILLPASVIIGVLWWRQKPLGLLLAPVYFVFLSLLMTALTAKVVAMALASYPVVPVIFIIPTFNVVTIFCTFLIFKKINPAKMPQQMPHRQQSSYA